jgi:hypothetical protein
MPELPVYFLHSFIDESLYVIRVFDLFQALLILGLLFVLKRACIMSAAHLAGDI